jgi:hypothetical protein
MVWLTLVLAICAMTALLLAGLQLRAFQDQEQRQLRAYVHVPGLASEHLLRPDGSMSWRVRPRTKNDGLTPAAGVESQFSVSVIHKSPSAISDAILKLPRAMLVNSAISYQGTENFLGEREVQISAGDLADIRSGSAAILVVGQLFYSDVFAKRRWTSFCYLINGPTVGIPDADLRPILCNIHNGADWSAPYGPVPHITIPVH